MLGPQCKSNGDLDPCIWHVKGLRVREVDPRSDTQARMGLGRVYHASKPCTYCYMYRWSIGHYMCGVYIDEWIIFETTRVEGDWEYKESKWHRQRRLGPKMRIYSPLCWWVGIQFQPLDWALGDLVLKPSTPSSLPLWRLVHASITRDLLLFLRLK